MNPLYRNDKPGAFPDSWYAATATIPPERPALRGDVTADVGIVGAGYTGLCAALTLAQRGFKVVVLDAHRAGWGASGRNGGQVGSGYNKSQRWLAGRLGADKARALWDIAEDAKRQVREFSAAHAPDARYLPGVAHGETKASGVTDGHDDAAWLARNYDYDQIAALDKNAMQDLVKTQHYIGGTLDMGAGHIHPLRYVLGLARAAEAAGVVIHERSEVHQIVPGARVTLRTGQGRLNVDHVILAGNGYLPNLDRQVAAKVMPINSFIAATEPLGDRANDVLSQDIAVADDRFVVNYFRLSEDKRLLFGGRENYGIGFPSDVQSALIRRITTLFPQLAGVKIDHAWGGTLGVTMTRLPAVLRLGPNILSASGFSGHGVALSGFAGTVMGQAIAGQAERFDIMAQLPVPAFPGGAAFRTPLLTLAMTWFSLRDRLGL